MLPQNPTIESTPLFFRITWPEPVSIRKDISKGDPQYTEAKRIFLEAKRKVDGCRAKIRWLEDRHNYEKLKMRIENKIATS